MKGQLRCSATGLKGRKRLTCWSARLSGCLYSKSRKDVSEAMEWPDLNHGVLSVFWWCLLVALLTPDNRLVQAEEVYAQQFNATIKSPVKSVGLPFCFALCLSSRDYVSVTRRLFARSERMGALRTSPWSGQAAAALCCSSHSLPATQGQRTPSALPSDAQTASFPETTTNRV
jgi:hypothetical protein